MEAAERWQLLRASERPLRAIGSEQEAASGEPGSIDPAAGENSHRGAERRIVRRFCSQCSMPWSQTVREIASRETLGTSTRQSTRMISRWRGGAARGASAWGPSLGGPRVLYLPWRRCTLPRPGQHRLLTSEKPCGKVPPGWLRPSWRTYRPCWRGCRRLRRHSGSRIYAGRAGRVEVARDARQHAD
jgi:hypothetical protein